MPEGRKRLVGATKGLLESKQDKPRLYPAALGAYVDGVKQIKVGSRPDFVWCRLRGSTSEVIQAFNDSVGLHWDLPILVYRDPLAPGMWKVYGRDIRQYADWEGASYLPPHGDAHSFGGGAGTGIDPVWVFKRQYMPLLPRPVVSGTLSIYIESDFWTYGGRYYWWPGSGTTSMAAYRPTGALNGVFVTVYMDGASKIPKFIKGEEFAAWYPPTDPTDYISLPTPTQGIPLAAVFMTSGTTWIGWGEIYDLRQPAEPLFDELATGSVVVRDEGTLLGSATVLNFVGPGVSASMSGSYCQVSIPGPGVDQIGIMGWDDGVPQGTGTVLNTTYGLDLTRSGTVLDLSVHPPTSGTVVVRDEGVVQGSVAELDFVGTMVDVSVSGTVARIFITGSTGGAADPPITGSVVGMDEDAVLGSALAINFLGAGVTAVMDGTVLDVTIPGGAGNPPITGSFVGMDEGAVLGSALAINFLGAGVAAVINGDILDVTIPGGLPGPAGPPGTFGIMGWDEGVPLGTGTILNVTGDGASLSLSGTVLELNVPGPFLQDDGAPLGYLAAIDFVGAGVTATLVGTQATVTIPGGAGNPPITGSFVALDEDAVLGSALAINFLGAGVTAVMDGDILDVTIPGGAGNPPITGSFVLAEEGNILGSATELNFIGSSVTATLVGSRANISISPTSTTSTGTFYMRRLLFDVVLAAPTGSIVMTAIPQDGEHLRLVMQGRVSVDPEVNVLCYFNGESGTAFYRRLYGYWADGLAFTKGGDSTAIIGAVPDATASPNLGHFEAFMPFYALTGSYHNTVAFTAYKQSTTATVREEEEATFLKQEAIRQIHIKPNSTQLFASGTHYQLWAEGPNTTIALAGGGTAPPITGSVVVDDEGVIQGSATELDFVGAGVTAAVAAGRATITIPRTDPPITGSFVIYDENVLLGSALGISFVGESVQAVISGTVAYIMFTGTATPGNKVFNNLNFY
jgi:hypothetical protein